MYVYVRACLILWFAVIGIVSEQKRLLRCTTNLSNSTVVLIVGGRFATAATLRPQLTLLPPCKMPVCVLTSDYDEIISTSIT